MFDTGMVQGDPRATLIKGVSGIIYLYFKNNFDKVLHKNQMRKTSACVLGEDFLSGRVTAFRRTMGMAV